MLKIFKRNNGPQEVALTVTTHTFIRILLLVVVSIFILAAIRQAAHAFLLIFTAFFLALALNAPVHAIAQNIPGKRRGSRSLATTFSFLTVVVILVIFLVSIVPPLIRQTSNFIDNSPSLARSIKSRDNTVGRFVVEHHLQDDIDKISGQLTERVKHAGGAAVSTIGRTSSSFFSVLTILVLTFMMLVEGPRWLEFMRELLPRRHQDRIDNLTHDMYGVVKGYVNGQVMLAFIAAALISPALFILHISYPVALIFIIFVAGLIPMVGHTIGAIIVTSVALFHSLPSAIIILAYYILYQQIENYMIQPRLQANTTNMSPLLVFMSVVIGVSFGGLFGGLVAIPVGGCIRIALIDYLQAKKMIDSPMVEEEIEKAKA